MNKNPNYEVYLIDSFTPEEDLDIIMKYLSEIKVCSLNSEFSKRKVAAYVQVSTLKYGFVFNLNEREEEVKKLLESMRKIYNPYTHVLLRHNENF